MISAFAATVQHPFFPRRTSLDLSGFPSRQQIQTRATCAGPLLSLCSITSQPSRLCPAQNGADAVLFQSSSIPHGLVFAQLPDRSSPCCSAVALSCSLFCKGTKRIKKEETGRK
ncbi:hypothetical protein M0R45_002637 [Rubus argutus]|uniref:Uncharacterized protein n=1 Tax=Rubus argutus TaxID=59490 RepID=A0AAW1VN70_RUBAR